jgi:4-hydroxybenzoate polyprenyltransferase
MSSASASFSPANRLRTYASFVRLEHTLFSLPLLVAGVFSAPGPSLSVARWSLIATAAVAARTAALALNRLIDRRIDALNPRTRSRELPAGRMRLAEAWGLLIGSTAVYLAGCALLGAWYVRVAWIPLLVFTVYPYLKRITPLCHLGVGLALALAPLAGYAAAHPDLATPGPALWLAGFALAWVSGFDIIYATLDEEFDRRQGVHSAIAWLGRAGGLRLSALLHAVAFVCLFGAGVALWRLGAPRPAWAAPAVSATLAVAGLLLVLEQRWAEDVNLAFFKVNVMVGFAVLLMVLVIRASGGFS